MSENPWDAAVFGTLRLRNVLRWQGREVVVRVLYVVRRGG